MTDVPLVFDQPAKLARAQGEIRAEFADHGGRTQIARLYETGGLRLRFPKAGAICEGVIVNTAGGIVGGDSASMAFIAHEDARVFITTQSAEKIYRSDGPDARLAVSLVLKDRASLEYAPQEAILFDHAAFRRSLTVDIADNARLLVCESVVFGRLAMGESCKAGFFRDEWRVSRSGRLIFAEQIRLDGAPARLLDRPAIGGGARAAGMALYVAPDAEAKLDDCRAILQPAPCEAAASAFNGFLLVRLLSPSPEKLRASMLLLLEWLRGQAAPRVWR